MSEHLPSTFERFLALDIHKRYLVVGGVNGALDVVLKPRRISYPEWPQWAQANLGPSDAVVLEATTNAWHLYDQVAPLAGRAVVAHPALVKLIASARVKTDARDAIHLARLLAANLLPEVWVPPQEVRELRALLAHRQRLVQMRTMCRNRLHSVLHRHNLAPPPGKLFSEAHRTWWEGLALPPTDRIRVRHDLASLNHFETLIDETEKELCRFSMVEPWAGQIAYLLQLPGIGLLIALTILAAVGDITRFPTPRKLVGYAGLGPGVHLSGETNYGRRITKQGRRDLRWVMVQAAWVAVERSPLWKARFDALARRIGRRKAITAIARKLLVVTWIVLSHHAADRHAQPEQVAFKFMSWSWKLGRDHRQGLTTPQFVRYQLLRLGLGHELHNYKGTHKTYALASPEEVLTLKPELRRLS
jgi:transposase